MQKSCRLVGRIGDAAGMMDDAVGKEADYLMKREFGSGFWDEKP